MMFVPIAFLSFVLIYFTEACPYRDSKSRRLDSTEPPHYNPGYTYGGSFAPFCKKTNGGEPSSTFESVCSAYSYVSTAFESSIPSDLKGAASLFAKALRLTWHDAGEYDQTTTDLLGPDGCLSYTAVNAGMIESTSIVTLIFDEIWQNVCDQISRADFWTMLGKIAFEYSQFADEKNFTTVRTSYAYGRRDNKNCSAGEGRLPSPQNATSEIIRVFITQMGLNRSDSVTLIGAHTLGYLHSENSGYGLAPDPLLNPTTNAFDLTPNIFDNSYFQAMVGVGWDNYLVGNDPTKNQWLFQVDPENPFNQLVLLNSDMVNAFPIDTSGQHSTGVTYTEFPNGGQTCGPFPNDGEYIEYLEGSEFNPSCTNNSLGEVLYSETSTPTFNQVLRYLDNITGNAAFLNDFAAAYPKMMSVGYGEGGKLGKLTPIDLSSCSSASSSSSSSSKNDNDIIIPSVVAPVGFVLLVLLLGLLFYCYCYRDQTKNSFTPTTKDPPDIKIEEEASELNSTF